MQIAIGVRRKKRIIYRQAAGVHDGTLDMHVCLPFKIDEDLKLCSTPILCCEAVVEHIKP